ncbi:thioredoxin-like protein [Gigaspora margarita]|uniref:Thioredoxin-like protein n=1 Tax=Gigaspora margarita TaxID=4874 RepID=A0A8H3XDW3_GIGMA|nr:thioredoxin-like protein [Gigaspora margarita]
MALAPQFAGHRWGVSTAPHVLEIYLDYVCPFSAKIFTRLRNEVFPFIEKEYPGKIQFLFRQQVQPWHPCSSIVHEAALAVERIDKSKFLDFSAKLYEVQKEYFDESVQNLTRSQINNSLAKHANLCGISSDQFVSLIEIPAVSNPSEARNAGNKLTADLKWHIKLSRQNGIHVSPTVLFDGIIDDTVSSSWTLAQWQEWLAKKVA